MRDVRDGVVLIVDDEPAILAAVCEILELEGYPVVTANHGLQALQLVEKSRPSLVLLDMRMPILDGWGFARALKDRRLEVPIVVMTAAQNARQWAQDIGAQGFVSKPFEFDELLEAVESVYGSSPSPLVG